MVYRKDSQTIHFLWTEKETAPISLSPSLYPPLTDGRSMPLDIFEIRDPKRAKNVMRALILLPYFVAVL